MTPTPDSVTRTQQLHCPSLPTGYTLTVRTYVDTRQYRYVIDVIAPGSYRTVHSLDTHKSRSTALADAELAVREHLERFRSLYPANVRSSITTWFSTLTKPVDNERRLFTTEGITK